MGIQADALRLLTLTPYHVHRRQTRPRNPSTSTPSTPTRAIHSARAAIKLQLERRQAEGEVVARLVHQPRAVLARREAEAVGGDELGDDGAYLEQRERLADAAVRADAKGEEGVFVLDQLRPRVPALGDEGLGLRVVPLVCWGKVSGDLHARVGAGRGVLRIMAYSGHQTVVLPGTWTSPIMMPSGGVRRWRAVGTGGLSLRRCQRISSTTLAAECTLTLR